MIDSPEHPPGEARAAKPLGGREGATPRWRMARIHSWHLWLLLLTQGVGSGARIVTRRWGGAHHYQPRKGR